MDVWGFRVETSVIELLTPSRMRKCSSHTSFNLLHICDVEPKLTDFDWFNRYSKSTVVNKREQRAPLKVPWLICCEREFMSSGAADDVGRRCGLHPSLWEGVK